MRTTDVHTRFRDLSGNGYRKTPYRTVYIPGTVETAVPLFVQEFGVDPNKTTCHCCGPDFVIYEVTENDIEQGGDVFVLLSEKSGSV